MAQLPRILLPFFAKPNMIGPPTPAQFAARIVRELGRRELLRVLDEFDANDLIEDEPEIILNS